MMKTTLLFPTPLWTLNKVGCTKEPLLEFIRHVQKEDPNGRISSNEGGWQSWDFMEDICDTNPLKELKDIIMRHAYAVCDEWSFKDYSLKMTNLWINVNKKGNYNIVHTHPGSVLSGVYYVDLPKCCHGPITFLKPFEQIHLKEAWGCNANFNRAHHNDYNDDELDHYPEEDDLLFFPSWLMHRVHQNSSDEDRISISFNISAYSRHYYGIYPSEGNSNKNVPIKVK